MARTLLHDGDKYDDQNGEHDRNDAFSRHDIPQRSGSPAFT